MSELAIGFGRTACSTVATFGLHPVACYDYAGLISVGHVTMVFLVVLFSVWRLARTTAV